MIELSIFVYLSGLKFIIVSNKGNSFQAPEMTTVVTREPAGGEMHELQVPPSDPAALGAVGGGHQLGSISEEGDRAGEGREGDQSNGDKGAEGLSGNVGTKPKKTPVKVTGLPPFHVQKLMGLRSFHSYCLPRKETSTN